MVPPLRTVAGVGTLLPVLAGAAGVGLLAGSRRQGVNFFTAHWPSMLLSAGGVELVVTGADNLHSARPAVFIFNHRNNFDPFIVASLVRSDFTGVGKKELGRDPVAAVIGKVVDAVFIDRDDARSAVADLGRIEELARKGLSVLISPEGTRGLPGTLGEFKKGPFRIAMSAGIPLVPVVLHNAEEIAARDSNTMKPGRVLVTVLPPVFVDHWSVGDLDQRIGEVRQSFLDALQHGPQSTIGADGADGR